MQIIFPIITKRGLYVKITSCINLTVSDSLKTTLTWLINTLSGSDSVGED